MVWSGFEWFYGYLPHGYHALLVTLASPYLEVALSGCLLFLQLFLEGGYEKFFFSSGPQLCMLKNIHKTYHWKAL